MDTTRDQTNILKRKKNILTFFSAGLSYDKLLFTCFHPHSLCNVALLRRGLRGGGERRDEGGGGRPGWNCSEDERSKSSPAGLSPDGRGGGKPSGDRCC